VRGSGTRGYGWRSWAGNAHPADGVPGRAQVVLDARSFEVVARRDWHRQRGGHRGLFSRLQRVRFRLGGGNIPHHLQLRIQLGVVQFGDVCQQLVKARLRELPSGELIETHTAPVAGFSSGQTLRGLDWGPPTPSVRAAHYAPHGVPFDQACSGSCDEMQPCDRFRDAPHVAPGACLASRSPPSPAALADRSCCATLATTRGRRSRDRPDRPRQQLTSRPETVPERQKHPPELPVIPVAYVQHSA